MSELAFLGFISNRLLTREEQQALHKDDILDLIVEVFQARGMEGDAGVSKLSIDELKEIPEVWDRGIIRRRESNIYNFKENEDEIRREGEEKLLEYVRQPCTQGIQNGVILLYG
jgi:hypothetical protein